MEVPRMENLKYDGNFQHTVYLINTLLFVHNNKEVKTVVRKQPLKQVFLGKKFKNSENPLKKTLKESSYW